MGEPIIVYFVCEIKLYFALFVKRNLIVDQQLQYTCKKFIWQMITWRLACHWEILSTYIEIRLLTQSEVSDATLKSRYTKKSVKVQGEVTYNVHYLWCGTQDLKTIIPLHVLLYHYLTSVLAGLVTFLIWISHHSHILQIHNFLGLLRNLLRQSDGPESEEEDAIQARGNQAAPTVDHHRPFVRMRGLLRRIGPSWQRGRSGGMVRRGVVVVVLH